TRLKRDPATTNTEVVAITGYYTEANMDRILNAGAAACLKKPLDVIEVRGRVIESFKLKDEEVEQAASKPRGSTKVLVVTQNADFRTRLREELSHARPAVEVLTAQTGADATLVAQTAPPQHVIVSLTVPDLESSDVINKLANSDNKPQIIAVHDDPTDEIRTMARDAGARMCLPTAMVSGTIRELLGV
ncbi:MAG: hypothetical protein KC431_12490, partial [Myxococcales bacterium]|nr:hypothetical protein [Myxococcales bacterium]